MLVSINQPAYLPWLGYFDRIARSDLHIVLDHVQFEKNSFTNRNRVRTSAGWCWLTLPVKTKGRFGNLPIRDLELADQRWRTKHWATLRQSYSRTEFFDQFAEELQNIFQRDWHRFTPLVRELTRMQLRWFDISTPIAFSSEMCVGGTKTELILELCRAVGADHYLSGPLGRSYLQEDQLAAAGIVVSYHDYEHPQYHQLQGGFEPYMAAVDLLFNCGFEGRQLLAQTESAGK